MTPADVWKAADAWVKGGENITLTSTAPVLTGNNAADPKLTLDWDGFTIDSQSNKVRTLVAGDNLTASDPTGAGGSTTLKWDGFTAGTTTGVYKLAAGTNIGIDVTKAGTNRVATIKYTGTAGGGDITEVKVTAPITGGGTTGAVTIGVSSATNAAEGVVQLAATDQRTRGGNTTRAMTPADVWKAADAWVKGGENITLTSTAPVLTGNNAADPKLTLDWDGFTIDSQSNKVRTLVAGDNLTASDPTGAGGSTTLKWDGFTAGTTTGVYKLAAGTNIGIDVTKAGTNRVATIKYTGTAGGGDITEVKVTAPITGGGTTGAVTIGVSSATNAAEGVVQLAATDQRTRGGNTTRAMTPADVWKAADAWVKGGENITLTSTAPVLTGNNAADPKLTLDWDGFTIDSQSNKVRTLVAGDNLTASDPTGAWWFYHAQVGWFHCGYNHWCLQVGRWHQHWH